MERKNLSLVFCFLTFSSLAILVHGYPGLIPEKAPDIAEHSGGQRRAFEEPDLTVLSRHRRDIDKKKSFDDYIDESEDSIQKRTLEGLANTIQEPSLVNDKKSINDIELQDDLSLQKIETRDVSNELTSNSKEKAFSEQGLGSGTKDGVEKRNSGLNVRESTLKNGKRAFNDYDMEADELKSKILTRDIHVGITNDLKERAFSDSVVSLVQGGTKKDDLQKRNFGNLKETGPSNNKKSFEDFDAGVKAPKEILRRDSPVGNPNNQKEKAFSESVKVEEPKIGGNVDKRDVGKVSANPNDKDSANVDLEAASREKKEISKKLNLVGLAKRQRESPNGLEEIRAAEKAASLKVTSGEQSPVVNKRNLVGLAKRLRENEAATVQKRNLDDGLEPPSVVQKRNIGASNGIKQSGSANGKKAFNDYDDEAEDSGQKLLKRQNPIETAKNKKAIPEPVVSSIQDPAGVQKRNFGTSNGRSDSASPNDKKAFEDYDLKEESSLKLLKRNNLGESTDGRKVKSVPNPVVTLVQDAGDSKGTVRKRNLVAMAKNLREIINSNGKNAAASNAASGKSKPQPRASLIGIAEGLEKRLAFSGDNLEKTGNAAKQNVQKRQPADTQSIKAFDDYDMEADLRNPKSNIRKRANSIGKSKGLKKRLSFSDYEDESIDGSNRIVRKRNYLALPENLRADPFINDKSQLIDFDLEVDAGEPRKLIRRGALASANSLGEESDENNDDAVIDVENAIDQAFEDLQFHRARSSDANDDDEPEDLDEDDDELFSAIDELNEEDSLRKKRLKPDKEGEEKPAKESEGKSAKGDSKSEKEKEKDKESKGKEGKGKGKKKDEEDEDDDEEDEDEDEDDEFDDDDEGYLLAKEDQQNTDLEEDEDDDGSRDQSFTLFTIANTDIGIEYEKVPYRERYLWDKRDAPCHSFNLKVPDETEEKSVITLCIFRPSLEFPDETKLFILNSGSDDANPPEPNKVFGYVMNTAVSSVYGRIVDKFFYGEVSIFDESTKTTTIFVVEEINLLNRLMRNNQKTLKHMLMVMHGRGKENTRTVYNAVVTKGASLIDFMVFSNPTDINRNSFIMFSTNHNSYICPGEPLMQVDENGQIQIESGSNKIAVENDGSVRMTTKDKQYTFRPHGRTIVAEGMEVRTLQEHEGSVAITAFTSTSSYDCVLPTPAFQTKRKGGYVCKVCVAVDELFTDHYIATITNDTETASNYLSHIIDRVSWIIRSIDFDDDNKPDNVGLDYDTQSLKWTYPDNNDEDLTEQDIEVLFQSLGSYDFADCCLGLGYTMKNFPNSGFARRPSQAEKIVGPSGVCSGKTGRIPNNLIIISANDKKGSYGVISEDQLIYLTANQIAGAFGASPDGAGDDVCDQFIDEHKEARHYLMWPDVLRNTTTVEQSLSTCSKKEIVKTLSTCKSSCFDVDRHPFCGNGIVEEGEECDCGSEDNCKQQTCCFSRVGKHPCRKSGIGCKSGSSSLSTFFAKGLFLATIGLLAMSSFPTL